jgi:hypothetical protein
VATCALIYLGVLSGYGYKSLANGRDLAQVRPTFDAALTL